MADHLFHGGPLAGVRVPVNEMDRAPLRDGVILIRGLRGHTGKYVRDEGSAGGRDWDWFEQ